ncbi:hypothetical protein [Yoonia sp. R78084]|uniref:hypothetical protein n=1 Tax=Yoonia sp. R78084 TaxID=3093869 RepID=UPI0037DD7A75
MSDSSLDLAKITFDMARAQLLSQKDDLRNLRNQASFGAAITGLIATVFATLLGSEGFRDFRGLAGDVAPIAEIWILLALFASSLFFSILVIVSWSSVTFEQSADWVIQHANEGRSDLELLQALAKEAEVFADQNEVVILATMNHLWWSLVLSWAQIPFWVLILMESRV